MTATLKDIAKLAGVSTASVSRAINNKANGNMRPETLRKIQAVIAQTMYTPNPLASGLRHGYTKAVGVVFPSNTNPYYARLGNLLENEAFENGHLMLLCNSNYDIEREKDYLNLLAQQRVSGVILCSTELKREDLATCGLDENRLVLIDEDIEGYVGEAVLVDDIVGGEKGAGYLFGLGHSEILIITGAEGYYSSKCRLNGVRNAFRQWGRPFDETLVFAGDYSIDSAKQCISEAIRRNKEFSAVFAFNDMMAIGTISALKHYGLKVPDDVSVIGYDNIPMGELFIPEITTIAASSEQMVKKAFAKILDAGRPKPAQPPQKIKFEPQLIIRESCRRCGS
ncbi:MAG: LacI family transcriptional regulator [Proteobacteria bacterium]|nr:LacI family transcriptional regulator [Pseudomonadota bacterium]